MTDKDIDKIQITVEAPKADVWVRNDYRDIVHRLGEVHMIRLEWGPVMCGGAA